MKLIKARSNVYGRQATAEERTRLRQFSDRYVTSTTATSTDDSERLRAFAESMLRGKASGKLEIVGTVSARDNRPVRAVKVAASRTNPSVVLVPAKEVFAKGTAGKPIAVKNTVVKDAAPKKSAVKTVKSIQPKQAATKSTPVKSKLANKAVSQKASSIKSPAPTKKSTKPLKRVAKQLTKRPAKP